MNPFFWNKAITVVFAVTMMLVLAGCEDIINSDDDDEEENGGLTVRVESTQPSPCSGTDEPLFLIWVYPEGSTDPDAYLAVGIDDFTDENGVNVAEAVAHERSPNENPNDNEVWEGDGGDGYDVYPSIYCVPDGDGSQIDLEDDLTKIHKEAGDLGWGVPLTYTQNGDKTFTTEGGDYVDP